MPPLYASQVHENGLLIWDVFGRSPGKFYMGLKIVDVNNTNKVNPLKLILRNITLLLGIIDYIFLFIGNKLYQKEIYKGNTKENIECINCGVSLPTVNASL